jgi:hypothetical protein
MSGVYRGAVGLNRAMHPAVKIPDIRVELRSKRIPGRREEGFGFASKGPQIDSMVLHQTGDSWLRGNVGD